ncbi:hypothetical protein [Jannaschia ovalis]|uniref:Lipoprotein n=1 Tax=Jannaschia ovalis TaxID=3038773 RepID=A0ABY8LBU3_9RHOB|nr:hypothetical protein [Jannaschia sp. GRR-S6-38]WGH77653.1 hypothetical protein P8627_11450 [Jannaschia sp. GRR-S6-38]
MRTLMLIAMLGLAGCGTLGSLSSGDSGPFRGGFRGASNEVDGVRFRTRVSATSEDARSFATATRSAGRSLSGALEAGRVRAVEYCITRFGGSDIDWALGPDRPVEEVALDESGALVLTGRCITR